MLMRVWLVFSPYAKDHELNHDTIPGLCYDPRDGHKHKDRGPWGPIEALAIMNRLYEMHSHAKYEIHPEGETPCESTRE